MIAMRKPTRVGHFTTGFVAALIAAAAAAAPATGQVSPDRNVVIYSYREPGLIQGLLSTFTWTTGIKATIVHAPNGLTERMAGAERGKADVLLTNDAALLLSAKMQGITQPIRSERIGALIPDAHRDRDGHWYSLSRNPRVLVTARESVPQAEINYEDLASPRFKGRICSRSGLHRYNLALLASMIAHHGEAKAESWLQGVKSNLVRKPEGGDRDQMRLVFEGKCDIAIVNSYYFGRAIAEEPADQRGRIIAKARMVVPNSGGRGAHTNFSGMAMAANPPNPENALRLMEFLASHMGQQIYVNRNHEYAVAGNSEPTSLAGFGTLKADPLQFSELSKHLEMAAAIVRRIRFDEGAGGVPAK